MFKKVSNKLAKILTRWTAILLVGLLVVYYVITLTNTNKIAEQVKMIAAHPYSVTVAAGEVETGLAQLRSLPERLFNVRSYAMIESVRRHYETNDEKITKNIELIVERYITSPEDAALMQEKYFELRDMQEQLLDLCENPEFTGSEAEVFYLHNMVPLLDELDRITATMLEGSGKKLQEFEKLASRSHYSMIWFSTILIVAVLTALFLYLYIISNKSRQEEEMRQVLREALKSAQNANAAKSQFLFNMSHDIRTPMNAIIGMTAIAGMHLNEPAKIRDCLTKISTSSKHLLGLINDVLDMSKIESGKIALNNEEFSLPEFIHGFITIVQPQVKAKQLDLDISINSIEHERVIGDTLRMNQILLNITGNAIKFTPPGGQVHIKINEMPPRHNGYGTYQFVIKDTGIGMPEEFLNRIFDPFERVQNTTNSKIEGTGLGMAITKNIVDMMNGQIEVESKLQEGSVFTVTLHLQLQKTEDEVIDFSVLRELKSLVVDDDRDVCENTARMLEDIGMKSEWVLSGEEAVEKAASAHEIHQDYHSVIIDWKMPGMDGLETTRRIREAVGSEVPIIILTAYDWTEIEEEAREAGVNAFLAKPLFKSRLYHVMQDVVFGEEHMAGEDAREVSGSVIDGRVLLVEDNALNMEIALEFITECGCTVEQAWDGKEAVRMVSAADNGYYRLVIMDVQMPNMDGYEATRKIREIERAQGRKHTPIVAMSANAFVEDMDKAYAAGMDGYITKPVGIAEIRRVLRHYADGKSRMYEKAPEESGSQKQD